MSGALLERLTIPDQTRISQRLASDPKASAWVSANAGAGKTKVLTDRILRLLLAGSPPGRILCLTFTKAAAANMAVKTFERLGRWVTLEEAALAAELADLTGEEPDRSTLNLARRLFARAVETPGGLKIETIHAFCERLLHLVPFEANVPARFAMLDEGESQALLERCTDEVLVAGSGPGDAGLAHALAVAQDAAPGESLRTALCEAVLHRSRPDGRMLAGARPALAATLGLGPEDTPETIESSILNDGLPPAEWPATAATLAAGKKTDQERADSLAAAAAASDPALRMEHYRAVFFTDKGEPRSPKAFVTKSIPEALKERLLAEQARLIALFERLAAARTLERTAALFTLAGAVRARVDAEKTRRGALDFDDLIRKTLALLERGESAWVLYKLDRGIDHVLVDEAQDTNPEQWAILRHLTEDFFAGAGARGRTVRTFFAVGDPKQSIYAFQGAVPRMFEDSKRHWQGRCEAAQLGFADVRLTLSFRSAHPVLSAVDATFALATHYRGLAFDDRAVGTVHETARPHAQGLVELWPVVTRDDSAEPDAWTLPVDLPESSSPPVVAGRQVAAAVKLWTESGDADGRVWRPGEILVLVRKRGPAFEAVIRELRRQGVPVAGQDRLDVGAHIAVLDVVAAGRAALLPEDDLTLAAALKSPLVGLTDDDLVRIAAARPAEESLAAALLRHANAGDPAARQGADALALWRRLAEEHGPFGFYAALLGPHEGRARLVARLGGEAGDALDVFLCAAHEAEAGVETPALGRFLARYEQGSPGQTVKRDLEGGHDEVRVMTVHGAKGLEASLVIVLDGCEIGGRGSCLVELSLRSGPVPEVPLWSPSKAEDCDAVRAARAALHELALEEHNRLLYVAMTRAKDRLVIAPYFNGRAEAPEAAWCEMIRRGLLAALGETPLEPGEAPHGAVQLWRAGQAAGHAAARVDSPKPPASDPAPLWLARPAPAEPEPLPPLRPSSALAAADRAPASRAAGVAPGLEARLRGTLVHALLERLPALSPERRAEVAAAFVRARAPKLAEDWQREIVAAALGVLTEESLAALFGPGSRAEVAIVGSLALRGAMVPVTGQMDRLAIGEREVLVADFKTGAPPLPGEPARAAHVAQIAVYRALLVELFPGHQVRCFIVYTAGPTIRELDGRILEAALARLPLG